MSVRITTLGALRITRGDRLVSSLPAQRLRCGLLIYLATTRESTRDRLLALFWAERDEDRARHALSQNVYELRRALGDDAIEIRGERILIGAHVAIDVLAFGQAVDDGQFESALSLYRGPFLDGFYVPNASGFEAWVDNQRLRAQRQHRRARRELITRYIDEARMREALIAAREWVAIDAQDDEAQHVLIDLLANSGDRAGAIRQYEAYERLLTVEELEPLDETRALVERIRAGDVGQLTALPTRMTDTPTARLTPLSAQAAPPTEPLPAPPTDAAGASGWLRHARRGSIGAAALGVVIVAGVLLGLPGGSRETNATASSDPHRVAVLYLEDLSPAPGAPHLAAAVTETLIEEFSGLEPLLTVRSAHAVAPFRGRRVPLDSIASSLAVDAIIDGDIAVAGGTVRVRVRLIDPHTSSVIATRSVEGREGEYFELLDRVVENAAYLLRQRLGAHVDAERSRTRTRSESAWLQLQIASEVARNAQNTARADIFAARRMFAQADSVLAEAERMDPAWLDALIQRGWLAERRALIERSVGNKQYVRAWLDSAVHHADRALAAAPGHAPALELRGAALFRAFSFEPAHTEDVMALLQRAEADLTTATRADPRSALAFTLLGSALMAQGRFAEANVAAREAARIDAFLRMASDNLYVLAMSGFELGYDAEAADLCERGLRRYADHRFSYCALSIMAWSSTEPPLPDSAWKIAAYTPYPEHDFATARPVLDMLVAGVLVRAGLPDSALAVLERSAAMPSSSNATEWVYPAVLARLGQTERAVGLLRQHYDSTPGPDLSSRRSRALRLLFNDPTTRLQLEEAPRRR
jgi:DNA-binding SARP family transcriptional activator/TolB-like protein